jgi:GSH-dependent disulfide-bond oxidoreductase
MIDFHYFGGGNPVKVAIMLAETGLEHRLVHYDLFKGTHLTPEFRKINPNNKLPAIVDHDPIDGGGPMAIFETGAILLYLAEKSGQFMPEDCRRRWLAHQWLTWQVAGLGPMHGQAHHFVRYAPEGQDYAVKRYIQEAKRLLNVAEYRLSQAEYFAEEYSIADMACYHWIKGIHIIGLSIDDYPAVNTWLQRLDARPAIRELFERPEFRPVPEQLQPRMALSPEQWNAMFGERQLEASLPGE